MKRFFRQDSGQVAILVALLLPVICGAGAFAVDLSTMYASRTELQNVADAAALSALRSLTDQTQGRALAIDMAKKNSSVDGVVKNADVEFGTFAKATKTFTVANTNVNAVRVWARRTAARNNAAPTFFANIWGDEGADLQAVAIAVAAQPTCFYVLNPSSSAALEIAGSGALSVPTCNVQVNSSSSSALSVTGAGTLTAPQTCVRGGVQGGNRLNPQPKTGCPALSDPLAGIPEPPQQGPCYSNGISTGASTTLVGNKTYCGNFHFSGNANITLGEGIYYFKGADVKIANSASITGRNVMLFLDSASTLTVTASGKYDLSAPTSGTYKGILIFQSRSANTNKINTIGGSADMLLDGTIYTPSVGLTMTGSSSVTMSSKSGYVIAWKFKYTGNSNFEFNAYSGVTPSLMAKKNALVW
jgi:Flp pilus assembly protein TadG